MGDQENINRKEIKNEPETNQARRRLTKAALTAPVISSLSVQPVFGCVSGFLSGNTSRTVEYSCTGSGCTPGFWKNNLNGWNTTSYSPGQCDAKDKHDRCISWDKTTGATTLGEILPTNCSNGITVTAADFGESNISNSSSLIEILLKVVDTSNNTDSKIGHYIAAILNASSSPAYGSSVDEVQQGLCKAVEANFSGSPNYVSGVDSVEAYKDLLDKLNSNGCFLDHWGSCEKDFVINPDDLSGTECIPACSANDKFDFDLMRCVPK